MRSPVLVTIIAMALGATGQTRADTCSCTYGGLRPCAASITCPGSEKAFCSCTSDGCSSSCGSAGPNQANDRFSVIQFSQMNLDGFRDHLEGRKSGWTVASKTSLGTPLTEEIITRSYVDLTLKELAETVAADFGLCVEIDEVRKTFVFKKQKRCM